MRNPDRPEEPRFRLLRNARREAALVLGVWALFIAWVVGYSCLVGYAPPSREIPLVAGMPSWVFYGIAVPWLVATFLTIVIGAGIVKDDELGQEKAEEHDGSG